MRRLVLLILLFAAAHPLAAAYADRDLLIPVVGRAPGEGRIIAAAGGRP